MKFLKLLFKNLTRSKTRSALTLSSIAVCIFIFSALVSLDLGVKRMVNNTSGERVLIVFEKYKACPAYSKLPVSYVDQISQLKHVEEVMPVRFFLSDCGTTTDMIAVHGVEPDKLLKIRNQLTIDPAQFEQFKNERSSAIVGANAAEKYGWKPGDQVTLPQLLGFSFTVRGIYESDGSSLEEIVMVDREYLERSIDQVGIATLMMVLVDDEKHMGSVQASIDSLFSNYETQTKSGPQMGFIADQIASFREIVGFAQLVAYSALLLLFFAVANSVSMGVRDRLREIALMKLIGFDSPRVQWLVIGETALLGLIAAMIGALASWLLINFSSMSISVEGFTMYPFLPPVGYPILVGFGMLLSVLGAMLPVNRAARRPIITALKGVD